MQFRLAKNAFIILLSQLFTHGLTALFGFYLARRLGAADFGRFLFASSFVSTFVSLADFGLETYLLRQVSRFLARRRAIFKKFFALRLFLTFLSYLAVVFSVWLAGYQSQDILNVAFYGLMLFPYSLISFCLTYLNAQEKVVAAGVLRFAYPAGYLLLALFLLHLGFGYRGVIFAVVLVGLIFACFLSLRLPFLWHGLRFRPRAWKKLLLRVWPFAVLSFLSVAYLRLDLFFLKRFASSSLAGLYGPVNRWLELLLVLPQAVILAVFPTVSRLMVRDRQALGRFYRRVWLFLLAFSFLPAVFNFFAADWLLGFFFGPEYLPAAPALRTVSYSLWLFFVNALPGTLILSSRRVKGFVPFSFANFVFHGLLCFWLIGRYSLVGAVWAKFFSELFSLVVSNLYVSRILNEKT